MRWKREEESGGVSRTKLLIGAAGLLLFIVGVKKTYRLVERGGEDLGQDDSAPEGPRRGDEGAEKAKRPAGPASGRYTQRGAARAPPR